MALQGALSTAFSSLFSRRDDDDLVDRLHYFLTPTLLVSLAILVSFKQFGGKPIECMCPEMFPSGWEQYAENYCWAQDTYYLPFDSVVPRNINDRDKSQISYYQWVPFFMLLQSCFFVLPISFWKVLSNHSGVQVYDIIKIAKDSDNIKSETRKVTIETLTMHMENALRFQRRIRRKSLVPHKFFRCLNLPYSSCFVTVIYLMTKVLFMVNVILQFLAMNQFLGTDAKYTYYGIGALTAILNGTTWNQSGLFPRVTLCDLQVRVMGNVQRWTIQCVLVINLFNEKIFIFLWFWYMTLFILTLISFLYWTFLLVLPWPGRMFIERQLELSEMPFDAKSSKANVKRFVSKYLSMDGLFVLRMVNTHCGVILGSDLACSLYKRFYGIEGPKTQVSEEWPAKLGVDADEHEQHEWKDRLHINRLLPNNVKSRNAKPKSFEDDDLKELVVDPRGLEDYVGYGFVSDLTDSKRGPSAPMELRALKKSADEQQQPKKKIDFGSPADDDDDQPDTPPKRDNKERRTMQL